MKLIPYSDLKPRNLGIILFVARLLAYVGYFFIGIALLAFASEIYNYIFPIVPVGGQGETYHGTYKTGVITLVFAIVILIVSALFAALVSWEASLKGPNNREI